MDWSLPATKAQVMLVLIALVRLREGVFEKCWYKLGYDSLDMVEVELLLEEKGFRDPEQLHLLCLTDAGWQEVTRLMQAEELLVVMLKERIRDVER